MTRFDFIVADLKVRWADWRRGESGSFSVEKFQVAEANRKPGVSFSTTTVAMVSGTISSPCSTTLFRAPVNSSPSP